jgi:hypothetical protein
VVHAFLTTFADQPHAAFLWFEYWIDAGRRGSLDVADHMLGKVHTLCSTCSATSSWKAQTRPPTPCCPGYWAPSSSNASGRGPLKCCAASSPNSFKSTRQADAPHTAPSSPAWADQEQEFAEPLARYVLYVGQAAACPAPPGGLTDWMTRREPRPGKQAEGSSPQTGGPGTTTRSSRHMRPGSS